MCNEGVVNEPFEKPREGLNTTNNSTKAFVDFKVQRREQKSAPTTEILEDFEYEYNVSADRF